MLRLTTRGAPQDLTVPVVGRVTRVRARESDSDSIFLLDARSSGTAQWGGYRGVITTVARESVPPDLIESHVPLVYGVDGTEHLHDGDVVVMTPNSGVVRTLYRPGSVHNVIFVTERCNSNCLICSQPPRDVNDDWRVAQNLELIRLMRPEPEQLTITGGEPTELDEGLCRILVELRSRLPTTKLHMLSNGRRFADVNYAGRIAGAGRERLSVGIPLYGEVAAQHDYVVQSHGAFGQTVNGIQQLARFDVPIEIRVVLNAATAHSLSGIAEFIYRNLPFVVHVAWMGMEPVGFALANWAALWIEPSEYAKELRAAVEYLWLRGLDVSIYNEPLCVLPRSLWRFSRKSISDWKNVYFDECQGCSVREACGGSFASARKRHSAHIKPITA